MSKIFEICIFKEKGSKSKSLSLTTTKKQMTI